MKIRVLLVGLLAFILSGCGDSSDVPLTPRTNQTESFQTGSIVWEVTLPESWRKVAVPESTDAIFLARGDTGNFVVLLEQGGSVNVSLELWENAKKEFFSFKSLNFAPGKWSFQAQKSAVSPMREFIQKIYPLPKSTAFLLGSCSFELTQKGGSDCSTLIDSWKISVGGTAKPQ